MDIAGTGGRDNAGLEVFFFRSFASAVRFSKTIVGDDGSNEKKPDYRGLGWGMGALSSKVSPASTFFISVNIATAIIFIATAIIATATAIVLYKHHGERQEEEKKA